MARIFKKLLISLVIVIASLLGAVTLFPQIAHTVFAASSGTVTGYLWSDTIGWIDLNCSNSSTCGTSSFGFTAAINGDISGYAWSENIGWVSANTSDTSGCPAAPCQAHIHLGVVTGWLKALAGNGSGWDGWIRLSGSQHNMSVTNGVFSGYAWGDSVTGWIDFSGAHTTFDDSCAPLYSCNTDSSQVLYTNTSCNTVTVDTCTSPNFCVAGQLRCFTPPPAFNPDNGKTGHLQTRPQVVVSGSAATLFWNISNVSTCSIVGSNGQEWSGAAAGCSASICTSGSNGKTTNAITQQTVYTLTCTPLSGTFVPESETVNILPVFREL